MTLVELVRNLKNLDDNLTIYIEADSTWSNSSAVIITFEPDDGSLPTDAIEMEYFLEVHTAKEVLNVQQSRWEATPTLEEKCAALIHYARYDIYLQS